MGGLRHGVDRCGESAGSSLGFTVVPSDLVFQSTDVGSSLCEGGLESEDAVLNSAVSAGAWDG